MSGAGVAPTPPRAGVLAGVRAFDSAQLKPTVTRVTQLGDVTARIDAKGWRTFDDSVVFGTTTTITPATGTTATAAGDQSDAAEDIAFSARYVAAVRAIESEHSPASARLFVDPYAALLAGDAAVASVKQQMAKRAAAAAAGSPIRVVVLQNMVEEGPGLLQQYLEQQGVVVDVIPPQQLKQALDPATYSALVVMGGAMSCEDRVTHPHLPIVEQSLRAALAADRPLLCVCLGAQILCKVTGGTVRLAPAGGKELGVYDIPLNADGVKDPLFAPDTATAAAADAKSESAASIVSFEWHSDQCEPSPDTCVVLSRSSKCVQCFRVTRDRRGADGVPHTAGAYGVQFHPEVSRAMMRDWVVLPGNPEDIATDSGGCTPQRLVDAHAQRYDEYVRDGTRLFRNWFALVAAAHKRQHATAKPATPAAAPTHADAKAATALTPAPAAAMAADADAAAAEYWGADRPFLFIRTRFIDDFCRDAVAASARPGGAAVRQVVLLGAGLDTRAYRCDWPAQTRVYEIDRPSVVAWKQRRWALRAPATAATAGVAAAPATAAATGAPAMRCDGGSVTLIGADLTDEKQWTTALAAAGHKRTEPTLWVIEGLVYYFAPDHARSLLRAVTAASAPGSRLVMDVVNDAEAKAVAFRSAVRDPRDLTAAAAPAAGAAGASSSAAESAALLAGWALLPVGTGAAATVVVQPGDAHANYGRWGKPLPPFATLAAGADDPVRRAFFVSAVKL